MKTAVRTSCTALSPQELQKRRWALFVERADMDGSFCSHGSRDGFSRLAELCRTRIVGESGPRGVRSSVSQYGVESIAEPRSVRS